MNEVKHKYNSNQGFTILESLVAIVLLGIVVVGSVAYYYYSSSLYYRALRLQLATWIVDSQMEQIKNAGCSSMTPTSTSVAVGSLTGTRTVSWPTGTTCTTATEVMVSVSWREPGDSVNRTVSARTLVGTAL